VLFLPLRPLGDGTIAIAQSLQDLFRYFFYGKSLLQIACRAAKFKRIKGEFFSTVIEIFCDLCPKVFLNRRQFLAQKTAKI